MQLSMEDDDMNTFDLLDPKNDFVFKKLFVEAPGLLAELINAVRHDHEPIEVVEILNPHIDPERIFGKFIILDVLAKDAQGRRYNIEMQVRRYDAWSARSVYYLANTLTQQLRAGEDYSSIKSVIGIHLLDFDLFAAPDQQSQAVWCFELRDQHQPTVKFGDELQFNIIELRKADRLGLSDRGEAALAAWITFMEHWQEEDIMAAIAYPPVQQALERIKQLSSDEETRYLAFARERARRDEISEIRAATEIGLQQGIEQGEIKGKLEGKIEGEAAVLTRLLNKRFGPLDDSTRARLNTATLEQLEHWTDRILDATSVDQVFRDT